jgi:hypothetical protein
LEQEATIQSYQDLIVYQKAYALAIEAYRRRYIRDYSATQPVSCFLA